MKRVVLKLSSGLLVRGDEVQSEWLDDLGRLVAGLYDDNYKVWLVTSGALALAGPDSVDEGQAKLFELYQAAFRQAGLDVKEVLLSKDQFEHRLDYLAIREQFETLGSRDSIALINEHEANIARQKFSDNDEIAGLVASMVDAERVVLSSTVEGVLDDKGRCITEVEFGDKSWQQYVHEAVSATGRGGMLLKCQAAEHSAQRGVEAIICDGKDIANIKAAITGGAVGTRFIADRRISARKRWLLDKKESYKGVIKVDDGLAKAIRSGKAVSLLTVGVTGVDGDFAKNEIVAIRSGADTLGYGQVKLDATAVRRSIADNDSRLLIHYDQYVRVLS
jgi:glutamate 5-kinase